MQSKILLLPVLAAICLGAPIPEPQVLGGGTTLSTRSPAQQTYTLVVPCYGAANCVPKTLTVAARNEPAFTIPSFNLPGVTRTRVARDPQVLGSATRTVIVGPTPPATTPATTKKTTSTKKSSTTKKTTSTKISSTTKKTTSSTPNPVTTRKTTTSTIKTSSTKKSSSTKKPSTTLVAVTGHKRQVLGSPTREVWGGWPWPTRKLATSIVTVTITVTSFPTTRITSQGDGISRTASATLVVPLDERQIIGRQVLGSPSRTVLVSPTAPPHPHPYPTSVQTVTVTVTYYPTTTKPGPTTQAPSPTSDYYTTRATEIDGGSTRTASATLVVPIDKRQTLGQPSRTVLVPTTIVQSITTTKVSIVTQTVKVSTTVIAVSTATVRLPVTQTLTKSAISTLTTTTCTENTSTTIWDSSPTGGPTDVTRTATATLIVPRQVLGSPSRSFTFFGSLPTDLPSSTSSVH